MLDLKQEQCIDVSDGAMKIIEKIVLETNLTKRLDILNAVCSYLENHFAGNTLEYHLKQMHLTTTKDILRAIDIYLIIKKDFPDSTFYKTSTRAGRKRVS